MDYFEYFYTRRAILGSALATAALSYSASRPQARDVRAYGALGDGVTDDTAAIQRAIDSAHEDGGGTVVLHRGTFLLRHRPLKVGIGALVLKSDVILTGLSREASILRLDNNQIGQGSFARVITSEGQLRNAAIRSLTIDGNRLGQGLFRDQTNGGNICLGVFDGQCIDVNVEDIVSCAANGQGIQVVGSIKALSYNISVTGCVVFDCSYIGIQSSQFDGLNIAQNRITNCVDNAIDIYGDDTVDHSTISTSMRALIRENWISKCRVGIFFESMGLSRAYANKIFDCWETGLRVNRIHGQPKDILVDQNEVIGCGSGISFGGETGGVIVRGNRFVQFTVSGVNLTYNVSNISITKNYFVPHKSDIPIVLGKTTQNSGVGGEPLQKMMHIHVYDNELPRNYDLKYSFIHNYDQTEDVLVGGFRYSPV